MLPDPLHPMVVHLPLALAVLLPAFALVAIWAIRRGGRPRNIWAVPVAAVLLLSAGAWVALETGENEEERVEDVLRSERPLHEHEEAAETFLLIAGVVTLIGLGGLANGRVGTTARWLTVAGSVVLLASAVQVGSAGGKLVYEHGAAAAYVEGGTLYDRAVTQPDRIRGDDEDDAGR
jgi:uncharacterized membrane protein